MVNPSTLNFLKELKQNNNKPWFDEHRKQYENAKSNYLSYLKKNGQFDPISKKQLQTLIMYNNINLKKAI